MANSLDDSWHYNIEEIQYRLNLEGLCPENAGLVAKSLVLLDRNLVDQIQKQVHFFDGVNTNAFHMPLDARFLKGKKCLIFLSQELHRMTKRNECKAIVIVLYEIAHYFLKHKSPIEINSH